MAELMERDIPTRAEEFTPEWLTRALGSRGLLGEARVSGVKREILGVGEGFMGDVLRLHLSFDGATPGLPRTMVAKLPTTVKKNRSLGELMGAYEREIFFYEQFASRLPHATPRVYYSDMDPNSVSKYEAGGASMMDRLPGWLLRPMVSFAQWIAGRRNRRYVMLIEDLSAGRVGDQIEGCTVDEARAILKAIAGTHAMHWGSPSLDEIFWLRRIDMNPRMLQAIYLRARASFVDQHGEAGSTTLRGAIDWLDRNGVDLMRSFHESAPQTLQHCDLRLDNVFFVASGAQSHDRVALFDWQLSGKGPGAYDVAYLLSGGLDGGVHPDEVIDLVRTYHRELAAQGVSNYDFDDCLRDYQRGLLCVLHRIASTDAVEMGDERGLDLMRLWLHRLASRLEGVDLGRLL